MKHRDQKLLVSMCCSERPAAQFDFAKNWKGKVSTIKSRQLIIYLHCGQARMFRFLYFVCFFILDIRTDTNSVCIETSHGNFCSYRSQITIRGPKKRRRKCLDKELHSKSLWPARAFLPSWHIQEVTEIIKHLLTTATKRTYRSLD